MYMPNSILYFPLDGMTPYSLGTGIIYLYDYAYDLTQNTFRNMEFGPVSNSD
jgi:hypothetical protein